MNEREALLGAVYADPEDSVPRLVYADWLEEHGEEELAEYVRLDCEIYRLERAEQDAVTDQRLLQLRTRRAGLDHVRIRLQNEADAEQPWRGARWYGTERGFPTRLSIQDRNEFLAGLAEPAPPHAARLWVLDYEGKTMAQRFCGSAGAGALAGSAHLAGLRTLYLSENHIGPEGAAALAASPHLAGLRKLDLSDNQVGDEGAAALANSPHLTRLKDLGLRSNGIGPEGAAALAASPNFRGLERLSLNWNYVGGAGAAALAASPHLAGLTCLALNHTDVGAAGAVALAGSPHLGRLQELWLGGVEGEAFVDEADQEIVLPGHSIGDAGAVALANSPGLSGLRAVYLVDNEIGDEGARALAASRLPNLCRVDLRGNGFGEEARALLRRRFGAGVSL